jgi:plasmid stabilization system protein ParE
VAYKILFTEDALVDLEVLLSYIRADNDAAAERLGRALLSHVELLQDFPRLGRVIANRGGVRMMVHFPIQIYYRIHEAESLIEILHFWHGSRREP